MLLQHCEGLFESFLSSTLKCIQLLITLGKAKHGISPIFQTYLNQFEINLIVQILPWNLTPNRPMESGRSVWSLEIGINL